ncbi:hypothetical protein [Bacillus sp. NEAU-Y102]
MSLENKTIQEMIQLLVGDISRIITGVQIDAILNEGIRHGFRDFVGDNEESCEVVRDTFIGLREALAKRIPEVRDVFMIWDGYLVPLPCKEKAVKLICSQDRVSGLVVYGGGQAYRLFMHEGKDWYTVSLVNANRVHGLADVKERMLEYRV